MLLVLVRVSFLCFVAGEQDVYIRKVFLYC